MTQTNAWGEPVPIESEQKDIYWVPPEEREDIDSGPLSDALDDETGDDMDDWTFGVWGTGEGTGGQE